MQAARFRQKLSPSSNLFQQCRLTFRRITPGVKASFLVVVLLFIRLFRSGSDTSIRAEWSSADVRLVVDGDTIEMSSGDRIRLAGVDTPEAFDKDGNPAPAGQAARMWLIEQIQSQPVQVRTFGTRRSTSVDRFGRVVGWVYNKEGVLINQQIIELGLSKLITGYGLPNDLDPPLRRSEAIARCRRRGVWR